MLTCRVLPSQDLKKRTEKKFSHKHQSKAFMLVRIVGKEKSTSVANLSEPIFVTTTHGTSAPHMGFASEAAV